MNSFQSFNSSFNRPSQIILLIISQRNNSNYGSILFKSAIHLKYMLAREFWEVKSTYLKVVLKTQQRGRADFLFKTT